MMDFSNPSGAPSMLIMRGISHTMLWLEILICLLSLGTIFMALTIAYNYPGIKQQSAQDFEQTGCNMMGIPLRGSARTHLRRFKGHFGVTPQVAANLWMRLAQSGWLFWAGVRGPKPKHLLWCLLWLKCYAVEEVSAAQVQTSEKNFRKWIWFYAEGMAKLDSNLVSRWISRSVGRSSRSVGQVGRLFDSESLTRPFF